MNGKIKKRTMGPRQMSWIALWLLAWLVPQTAVADDFLQNKDNFKAMELGLDRIQFTLPTQYDGNLNEGITEGWLGVSYEGQSRQDLIHWWMSKYRDLTSDSESGTIYIEGKQNGSYQLAGKIIGGYKTFGPNTTKEFTVGWNDDNHDHFSTTVIWTVPYELRGKTLTFWVKARSDDRDNHWYINGKDEYQYIYTWTCPSAPEVSVTLSEPMLAVQNGHVGEQMMVYSINARSVNQAILHYTDSLTGQQYTAKLDNKLVGQAYIPADRPFKDIYVSANVVNAENQEVPGEIKSGMQQSFMLHYPKYLDCSINSSGHAVLTWIVDNAGQQDLADDDNFEIQRNLTGSTLSSDPYWTTIDASVSFKQGQAKYTFTDETLADQYKGTNVTYRIRRSYTNVWRWANNSGYSMCQLPTTLTLPSITSATVTRGSIWNDDSHLVNIAYSINGKTSSDYDAEGRYILRSYTDFMEYANMVNSGQVSLNAIMANDIDISETDVMIGTENNPFQGTFDGNGCTLTVNYNTTEQYTAPFRFAQNAKIKKLRVDGTLHSSAKFVAGLVGCVIGGTSINNCCVSATLSSAVNGDATNGGFVAVYRGVGSGSLEIMNCLFNGKFIGDNCNSNGGFIGWCDKRASLSYCLFAPSVISTGRHGCSTFSRTSYGISVYLMKCYFTQPYEDKTTIDGKEYMLLYTQADWDRFSKEVEDAKGGSDVNAIMMADISTDKWVGMDVSPYRGIFDGNGYTLTFNTDWGTNWLAAPFPAVKDVTVRNLHVAGNIIGGSYSSGLIGHTIGNPTINIERVCVSASVTTRGSYVGGFMGSSDNAKVVMNHCRFDGSLSSTATSGDRFGGAFIAAGEGSWEHRYLYENSSASNINRYGMNYYKSNAISGQDLCLSSHDWHEVAQESRSISNEDTVVARINRAVPGSWQLVDGKAVPRMETRSSTVKGDFAGTLSKDELRGSLGYNSNQWEIREGEVVPRANHVDYSKATVTVWDRRAKLLLRVNMHGESGVDSKLIDLSDNQNATVKHNFIQELTRQCVDYSFDLIVKRGSSLLRIDGTDADSLVVSVKKVDEGDLQNYRFDNVNLITSLTATKKQSSVMLVWETSGGDHDFFRVLRRKHSDDPDAAWTDTVATNLVQNSYEDKTVLVQQVYDYRVESVWQCEGVNIKSMTCTGQCETTGRIDGYIRMADGTAMAGVTVECRPSDGILGASAVYSTVTDEAGYFKFAALPYQSAAKYYVTVPASGDMGSYTAPNALGEVNFTASSNWTREFNFYMDTYYVYSGNIYYRDTSIPVAGVSFKLDGNVMRDASGNRIITDTQGAFELSIPRGAHSVQAVKDGHIFADDGFLINPDATTDAARTLYNFTKNVASVYLWDSTTVVLRGRVTGGDIEGSKPLGNSLSRNNLGDSIKIVMQLEGDNTSWLIRKQNDETVKSAAYSVPFGLVNKDTARINITRHTLTIRPDSKTGEYQFKLHPAKYKVIEVSAQGYATLFQQGKVGETIDLTFNVQGDTCEYSRIYHSVPDLQVTQFNPGNEPYFGSKRLTSTDNIGNKSVITTWYYRRQENGDSIGAYAFGHPLFMAGSPYGWMLQACEKYYWNNVITNKVDVVNLSRGKVTISNAMLSRNEAETVTLDETGGGSYVFTPDNSTFLLTGENALKSVSITLEYDGNFYDIKPMDGEMIKGYVMATTPQKEGRKGVVAGTPKLFDVLRDPPGGGSSAYIEEGSKLSYSYSADLSGSGGMTFTINEGRKADLYHGQVFVSQLGAAGTEAGTFMESSKKKIVNIDAVVYYGNSWTYTYNMDLTERIQTSSGKKWIGPKADLFIGMTDEVILEDAIAVRVIPDSVYKLLKTHEGGSFPVKDSYGNVSEVKVKSGAMKVLAQGTDNTGKAVYLVRDEVLSAGLRLNSTFVHSQNYIENELLPDLIKTRNGLLLPIGTSADYAQALADRQGYPAYISTVKESDDAYGFKYTQVNPVNTNAYHADSISQLNQTIMTWISFLAQNEETKLGVTEGNLVKRYEFDGAASIQYSETFTGTENESRYLLYPGMNDMGQISDGLLPILGKFVQGADKWLDFKGESANNVPEERLVQNEENHREEIQIKAGEVFLNLVITPKITLNFNDKNGKTETQSKKIGFTLSASGKSSMTVDVYRTASVFTMDTTLTPFNRMTYELLEELRTGKLYSNPMNYLDYNEMVYSNFVYRTRGGVTCQPYEGERTTKWYQPGAVIDVATIPADKPSIWIEEPVKSNVPFDEPARFKLHFANETDYPDRASIIFTYLLQSASNPNGAKVYVDGMPINSEGVNIILSPSRDSNNDVKIYTKEIEVYPGTEFDYNNLKLVLFDPEDPVRTFECSFSAHFVPTAGKVTVTSPGSNWVMNTESPYDGKRQAWYMPVRIEGFNTNYRGFDHIELQYKLSTQGDKDWVSVCSYYASDSLRAKASGVTDTIPNSGAIIARFYGEVDPVEQYYDLRAVNYCRHAGGFLTGISTVLKGIKDTRLPELFGTPEPVNGILGIGNDIKLTFSEPIAGNYLSKINNFELLGSPTNNDISTSTSLTFDGQLSAATSQAGRNLAGKSFTVDVMLNPDPYKGDMTVFWHGGEENGVRFGLSADRRLTARVNGQTVTSDSTVRFSGILQQVAYVLDQSGDSMTVNFFDGSRQIGSKPLSGKYDNSDYLHIGSDIWDNGLNYKGDMLEFRLWNRALTPSDLNEYGKKQLSGYESGLVDYYRMNEGMGEISYDHSPGASDLRLQNIVWKRPAGISVKIDGKNGMRLKPDKFMRSGYHDFTLMFWFRLQDLNATIFSSGAEFNIGVENGGLYVCSAGWQRNTNRFVNDGEWHHFSMTVSRSRNVANIYIDDNMVDAFAAENIRGISGDHIALGATYVDKNTPISVMTGNIDEVGMFASVLPEKLLSEFTTHTPMGELTSLMAYLDFGRPERQDNNTMRLEPTGISIKRYKDNQGNIVERRDTLIDVIPDQLVDRSVYAPMVSNSQLENLNFSYITNGNQLLVNIKEPDYTIEKTNVYLTVKEVPDLQGNLMASPVTMNVYVYRNPLRWDVTHITRNIGYGQGLTFEATVRNLSGNRQTFELNELPVWITASQTSGYINALDELTITFSVSPYINIGTYNEQIEVTNGNGMSEPLTLTLNVRGEEPEWAVSNKLKEQNMTMMMVARVKIDGVVANSAEDILGVFDENLQTLGVARIEVDNTANANEALAYLTIYGYTKTDSTALDLHFMFFDASSGKLYSVKPMDGEQYTFCKDAVIGSATAPVEIINEFYNLEWIKLKQGWNWVTFNVRPKSGTTVSQFLDDMTIWEPGDKVVMIDGTTTLQYTCRPDKTAARGYRWDNADQVIDIDPTRMYSVYSVSDKIVHVEGYWSYSEVTVHKDWNRLGYTPTINLPLAQALSGYTDEATEGDVIKSQDGFAVATRTASGIVWKGSLQYMETGKGYMLKRQAGNDVSFLYPLYMSDNRYSGTAKALSRSSVSTSSTMNIVASVNGIDVRDGDRLIAYLGGERKAEAVADDEQHYYLNIGNETNIAETIYFVIERDGQTVATTRSSIRYEANGVIGTPKMPTQISFVSLDVQMQENDRWYTIGGVMLDGEPERGGVYIYKGKVVERIEN